jgi:hypothetical protein
VSAVPGQERPPAVPTLVAGTRIVHIGAAKTGTTSVQASFAAVRDTLPELGVLYPGTGSKHKVEMDQVLGRREGAALLRLRQALDDHPDHRVVLSAERLAQQLTPEVQRVHEVVGEPMHVVLTLRSVADFLASMWQQEVKSGETRDIDAWTRARLDAADRYNVLRRDDGVDVVHRWAREVGPENMTVIVLERSSPERLFAVFEALCGLSGGTLQVAELNRGLTWPEAELVRAVNIRVAAAGEAARADLRALVHMGVVSGLVRDWGADRGEAKPVLPRWSAQQVADLGARLADDVRASGVRVVGDLAELARTPQRDAPPPATAIAVGAFDAALHGLVRRTATMVRRRGGRVTRGALGREAVD